MSAPPPPEPEAPRPVSVATVILIIVAVLLAFAASIGVFVWVVFSGIRNSDATRAALTAAERFPQVTALTGRPLTAGHIVSGNIDVQNSGQTGQATLTLPVSGPHGHGTVYAVEQKRAGVWTPETLEFWPASDPNHALRLIEPSAADPVEP